MSLRSFYDEQVELLNAGDGAALVEKHYAPNAVMINNSTEEPIRAEGHDALKGLFSNYLQNIYRGFISTDKYTETDDSIFFEATIDTVYGQLKVYDVMILEDGKIVRHYSGAK